MIVGKEVIKNVWMKLEDNIIGKKLILIKNKTKILIIKLLVNG